MEARPRPHLDDKVLTAWNGLMIAAFARAARVLPASPAASRYLAAANRAASFIKRTLWQESSQQLLRRYRDGDAAIDAYAEDYAYLVFGLLELFQAAGDPQWLEWARTLQDAQDRLFWDDADAGWFSTSGSDPSVLLRLKEDYDGAEPAAGSVAVLNALTLESLLGGGTWLSRAERTLARFGPRLGGAGRVVPMMMCGLSAWYAEHSQIVVVGDPADADTFDLQSRRRRQVPSVCRRRARRARSAAGGRDAIDAFRGTDGPAARSCDRIRLSGFRLPRTGDRRGALTAQL